MKSDRWKDRAVCVNSPVDFYSDDKLEILAAKSECSICPARIPCREAGIGEEWGVWGGLSRADRKAARREAREVA